MSKVDIPSFGEVETVTVVLGVAVIGFILYKAVSSLSDLGEKAASEIAKKADNTGFTAPLNLGGTFNASEWRPAGYYWGDTLMLATGGMEKKPVNTYDPEAQTTAAPSGPEGTW